MSPPEGFHTTIWAEIDRARRKDPNAYLTFVNRYRPPVVAYLRRRGVSADDAEDLAQEVFLAFVQGDLLSRASPARGKFRNLILAVTKKLMLLDRRRRSALKRGRGEITVPLDEAEAPAAADQEEFDRLWAEQITRVALQELGRRHPDYRAALEFFLEGRSYAEIAKEMGRTVTQVTNYVHRARERLPEIVRELLSEYCDSEQELKEELRHLGRFEWK